MPLRETFPSPLELRGAVHGTLLYLSLYLFGFLQFQSYSKFYLYFRQKKTTKKQDDVSTSKPPLSFKEVKYYNAKNLTALTGDRTVGNFLEQAILFLPLLWMHALFIDPSQSFRICLIYTITRSYYPITFATKAVFLSTVPGYIILLYLMYQLLYL